MLALKRDEIHLTVVTEKRRDYLSLLPRKIIKLQRKNAPIHKKIKLQKILLVHPSKPDTLIQTDIH